ncbi:AAA family ATPase [Rhodanobacter sp. B2A1Ga4]|uniref:helicase RepA family protein n=1 Tax=Rhodanobacter TaxID=75309 RepID=UPI000D3A4953|nr:MULTISPECIES: helicase RepA family protein [Rhodanobacter]MBQ4853223.1 AAA family ATPase [Rhodanobacter sp. B2A1Ga4]
MSEGISLVQFKRADRVEFKATEWLIDGWLVKDTTAGLVAPSGACKSFLAIDWACRVATGSPWFGRNVKQGAVFYLAGEGRTGLRKRIAAWEKYNGIPIEGAPLYLADGLPFLCDDYAASDVIESIKAIADEIFFESGCDPELIVIDTVARAMGGANENSSEDMGRFVRSLDVLRAAWKSTILTVHHTGLDPNSQDRARGSSAYRAALDSEMVIKPGDPEFTLRVTKAKDWPEPSPLCLRRVSVDIELSQSDGSTIKETSLALHDSAGALVESKRRSDVIELKRKGLSLREIEKETGISRSTASRWLKEAA